MNSNLPSNPHSMTTSSTLAATTSNEASGKKVRKTYTVTKSRESWTGEEHDKFLEALQLFDRDWKKIEDFVGSKTVIQIRSHAQKYFLKVQKNGAVAHVPPPRPKRRAAHPYPQKTPKTVLMPLQASVPHPSITAFTITPVQSQWDDSSVLLNAPSKSDMINQDEFTNFSATDCMNHFYDIGSKGTAGIDNKTDRTLPGADLPQTRKAPVLHGLPDFAKVYSLEGSVFDPDTKGHVHELKDMDTINFESYIVQTMKSHQECGVVAQFYIPATLADAEPGLICGGRLEHKCGICGCGYGHPELCSIVDEEPHVQFVKPGFQGSWKILSSYDVNPKTGSIPFGVVAT